MKRIPMTLTSKQRPVVGSCLAEIVHLLISDWPIGVTGITQDIDGVLTCWSAPLQIINTARNNLNTQQPLMPLIGAAWVELTLAYIVLAKDWQTMVVTEDVFIAFKSTKLRPRCIQ